ncbi:MAG: hypothetical protein R3B40_10345 [Polyangiales bacterium]
MTSPADARPGAPTLFRSRLTSRWHEIDGSRVARPRVLMDFMEHARAQIPTHDAVHHALNHGLARAIRIELHAPLLEPADIDVAVWLSRCGTSSYAIEHELTRATDGALLARAQLVFVRVGADRRPAPVDPAVTARVHGHPQPLRLGRDLPVPAGAPRYTRAFQVLPSDENRGRHAGHTQVVDYLDDTRRLALLTGALPGAAGEHFQGATQVAVDYEGELHVGDWVEARVWSTSNRAPGALVALTRRDDDSVVARGQLLWSPP